MYGFYHNVNAYNQTVILLSPNCSDDAFDAFEKAQLECESKGMTLVESGLNLYGAVFKIYQDND